MRLFGARSRPRSGRAAGPATPHGFDALEDALRDQRDAASAAAEIGLAAAAGGAALDDVLADLEATYRIVSGRDPDFSVTRALAVAWSEASLRYLHDVSCEDPLTVLCSLSHVRTRLGEIYRQAERAGHRGNEGHALVVVELAAEPATGMDAVIRLVDICSRVRAVYSGGEVVGRLNARRVVAVVHRDAGLGSTVQTLRELITRWQRVSGVPTRIWIEGLPAVAKGADILLDELAR
jgi:hypothetical protein